MSTGETVPKWKNGTNNSSYQQWDKLFSFVWKKSSIVEQTLEQTFILWDNKKRDPKTTILERNPKPSAIKTPNWADSASAPQRSFSWNLQLFVLVLQDKLFNTLVLNIIIYIKKCIWCLLLTGSHWPEDHRSTYLGTRLIKRDNPGIAEVDCSLLAP